jgi:hypothetical protein|uniref:Uncharacterized protein n=1 Tax=uncultured Caudovirales phage TaxID=2100421 RepID=A0A6J5L328_9CAUD|nr:hypothetical protein UFOVP88_52 [uncultured Caudovirales phage]
MITKEEKIFSAVDNIIQIASKFSEEIQQEGFDEK